MAMDRNVDRISLESELADIEQELSRLQADQSTSAGLRVARQARCEHLREKKRLEIKLHDLKGKIDRLKAEYEYSKTPGAHKMWRDRWRMRQAGWALGRVGPMPTPQDTGPGVEALRNLRNAESERDSTKAQLADLCKKDTHLENLVIEKEREQAPTVACPAAEFEAAEALLPASPSTISQKRTTRQELRSGVNENRKHSAGAFASGLLKRYRSELKRAVLIQLMHNPDATDLEICRGLDADGTRRPCDEGLAKDTFAEVYMDSHLRNRIETAISKVRRDLRELNLLPPR